MELRHIRYFIAVAEEAHMTRAAERLGIQQPPLSQQIRALEEELGVALFRRLPRGMELTAAGAAFLEHARSIMEEVDRAFASAQRTARGELGSVAVGFTSSAPFHPFLPRIIRAFREAAPKVSLVLEESGSRQLVQAVHADQIDAAFIRSTVADTTGLNVEPILTEEMLVALPAAHPLARAGRRKESAPLPLSVLASETFILYKRPGGPGLYDTIIAGCRDAGFSPRVGQEAPRIVSTLNLVAAGLGVSIVPASLRRLQMDGVIYRRLSGSSRLRAPLILVSRRRESSAAVERFIALVHRMSQSAEASD